VIKRIRAVALMVRARENEAAELVEVFEVAVWFIAGTPSKENLRFKDNQR